MQVSPIPLAILVIALSYLMGSIPFGYLINRMSGGGDIREKGSGNIGATNVFRSAGTLPAVATLALDAGKGMAAVLIAKALVGPDPVFMVSAPVVVAGHMFPIFLRFKGGKGVATGLGAFAVLAPLPLAESVALFAVVMLGFRIVSLASICAAALMPIVAHLHGRDWRLTGASALCAFLIIVRHRSNINRLLQGEEKPINRRNG